MKICFLPPPIVACVLLSFSVDATVHYVDLNCTNPVSPYTDWSTAATNIQDAVDVTINGDRVLVTNGIYQFGGRFISSLSNRVAITKPVVVQSVGGPQVTAILGRTGNSGSSIRCAYLTNGAVLSGFTLTNGAMSSEQGQGPATQGGGAYCQSAAASLTNCVITSNSAAYGGGVYQGTLNNCVLSGNKAASGGGTYLAILNNCAVVGNLATSGGGASLGTLNNCTLTGNSSTSSGGGSLSNTLNNCIVYYNNAPSGSNYSRCILNQCCTIPFPASGTNNFVADAELAGAFHISAASPCRAAGNPGYISGTDIDGELWANPPSVGCDEYRTGSVTGPLNVSITANYTNVGAGYAVKLTGTINGRASASVWDFGDGVGLGNRPYASHVWTNGGNYTVVLTAYNEDCPGGVSNTLTMYVAGQPVHYVSLNSTNPVAPYTNWETAALDIQSAVDQAVLPGESVLVFNGVYQTGGRMVTYGSTTNRVAVERAIRVSSVNGPDATIIQGQRGAGGGIGDGAVRCIYLASGAVLEGFTLSGGATTSYDIGGGVDCASTTAVLTNCILVYNYALLGGGAYYGTLNDCILRYNSAYYYGGGTYQSILNNCIVTGNGAVKDGGGTSYGVLNNCIVTTNRAEGSGGGTRYSTLNDCILRRNSAEYGGGAYYGTLNNCTLADNYAYSYGGGTYQSTLNNCIVYYNNADSSPNYSSSTFNYCCTTPNPGAGAGNITNVPMFVDRAGGNLRLQSNSPCINAGNNAYVTVMTDLDGNQRISGGTVDIGAYEFQNPASVISYAWLQQYSLTNDGAADYVDADHDGLNNWQEWHTGTVPNDPASLLKMLVPTNSITSTTITWQSVSGMNYFIQRSSDLGAQPPFSTIQSNITGQAGTTSYTDTTATNGGSYFYRVGVP
ncbi:MAG: choice-of-anchor Q domain-containing protein [Verrucomicrobiota bacterium]|jgi:hypothetical protein